MGEVGPRRAKTLTKVPLSSADGWAWRVLIQQADKDSHYSGEKTLVFFLLYFLMQTWVLCCLRASRFSQAEGSNLPLRSSLEKPIFLAPIS